MQCSPGEQSLCLLLCLCQGRGQAPAVWAPASKPSNLAYFCPGPSLICVYHTLTRTDVWRWLALVCLFSWNFMFCSPKQILVTCPTSPVELPNVWDLFSHGSRGYRSNTATHSGNPGPINHLQQARLLLASRKHLTLSYLLLSCKFVCAFC